MLVLCSVSPGKEGLITDLKQKSSDYFLSVFVPYRYSDSGNLTAGRCPGSKALVFYRDGSRVTVPNVNIGDCDYTIAFWIRFNHSSSYAEIVGSSRSGKSLDLFIGRKCLSISLQASLGLYFVCMDAFSSGVDMNNWTHVVVTCEQVNSVKLFLNGEILNMNTIASGFSPPNPIPPKETFFIDYFARPVIMDLHILGFALPRDEIYDLYRG